MQSKGFDELLSTNIKILDSFLGLEDGERYDGAVYSWRSWTMYFLREHYGPHHPLVVEFMQTASDISSVSLKKARSLLVQARR